MRQHAITGHKLMCDSEPDKEVLDALEEYAPDIYKDIEMQGEVYELQQKLNK